ncbi:MULTISPECIES: 3'-5' exonuclease family protein [unclassified Halomonas]|uniref:3'-5' exonuclease family protein n=1 Tax=unclassified Halomonas TaxID=2609666 RepID=UPI00209FBEE8|nr:MULTISPECIES: 3'-5' exonuclease family protein [unclassified Halomonas]MCP1314064.1 exonuclease domain-containing protein [Halomonas sp. 707D7]MCP1327662.1 exonuclease domain-containing protein [Halomonas sp. 707D4]
MSQQALIFIDLETTGTRATRDRITEIAALKVVEGQITERWVSLIDPGIAIPPFISRLTGIHDDMVADAPSFAQIAPALREWLGDGRLVAHNARFDAGFLRNAFKRAGLDYRPEVLCTLRISRRLEPAQRQHNLKALLSRFAIDPKRAHRAEDDAEALWRLWQTWQQRFDGETWQAALAQEQQHKNLPANLDSDIIADLPSAPGVYLFYGHNRLPLYVGKSINLRNRVKGHFQRDHQDDKAMRMLQQIQHVEWEETAGDLGAQLREAQLIKELMPIMNRQLRRQGRLKTWHWGEGEHAPTLAGSAVLANAEPGQRFGLFRNAAEAKQALRTLCDEHKLCAQVLGLDKGKGRCFKQQLGKCLGACCQKESLEAHTARAHMALERLKVDAWPWPGRIVIRERSAETRRSAYHVVDHWCYLGSGETLAKARRIKGAAPQFDVDTYRILNRFLRDAEAHRLTITAL